MKFRVAIASSSLLAVPSVEILSGLVGVDVIGFISTPDRPKGRSGEDSPNPFAAYLERKGIEVFKPKDHLGLVTVLRGLNPDLVVVIAYGRLIKREALEIPGQGWINLHFSLLPAMRGAAPVQRALAQGQHEFGFSIFKLDEGMDSGPIYLQETVPVSHLSCATTILDELARRGASALPRVLEMITTGKAPEDQHGVPTFAPKFTKSDTRLDLSKPGPDIFNQIRAFTRTPGAWVLMEGKRIVITEARPSNRVPEPGNLLLENGALIIGLGGIGIELQALIPEGRREMSGIEFARGLRMEEGVPLKVNLS